MENQISETYAKIRQQYNFRPYLKRQPLELSPEADPDLLYQHHLASAYYLKDKKFVDPRDKVILDAGCGSGWKTLALAIANPGAKIVGVDLSEESTELAQKRLSLHGFQNARFHAMPLEEISKLDLSFDYINCDETLYLLPDIVSGLKILASVLNPQGIIRANLHSAVQRSYFFRAQEVCRTMGLLNENPGETEVEATKDFFQSLKGNTNLKRMTWLAQIEDQPENLKEYILMNYLLQGDKGYFIRDLFSALEAADLDFVSMINWQGWNILKLFQNLEDLPFFLALGLSEATVEERLHLYEQIQGDHRLLDFWCTHQNSNHSSFVPVEEWTSQQWQSAQVYLNPILQKLEVKEELIKCITQYREFEISRYLPVTTPEPVVLERSLAACLLPLWGGKQTLSTLVDHWLNIRPLDLVTSEPIYRQRAEAEVKDLLTQLESFLYVFLVLD